MRGGMRGSMKLEQNEGTDKGWKLTRSQIVIIAAAGVIAVIIIAALIASLIKGDGSVPKGLEAIWLDITDQETELEKDLDYLQDMGIEIPDKEIDLAELRKTVNEDIYAWIYIPGTEVDYPVLQHPEDDSYYLNHNLDNSAGYPGVIYSETCNSKDFEDPLTVLYGHNMKDGSMFGNLYEFQDIEYMEAHPYIYVYTDDRLLVYEIVASYDYTDRHLLLNDDLSVPENYKAFLTDMVINARKDGVWKGGVDLQTDDRLLALSTCISGERENRLIVQGVLVRK